MRLPSFNTLIKTNRHYKSKVIISSQNLKDIMPEAHENIEFLLVFKGLKREILEKIYEDWKINLPYPLFEKLYDDATNLKHSFLYIDTKNIEFRRNFNELLQIN